MIKKLKTFDEFLETYKAKGKHKGRYLAKYYTLITGKESYFQKYMTRTEFKNMKKKATLYFDPKEYEIVAINHFKNRLEERAKNTLDMDEIKYQLKVAWEHSKTNKLTLEKATFLTKIINYKIVFCVEESTKLIVLKTIFPRVSRVQLLAEINKIGYPLQDS